MRRLNISILAVRMCTGSSMGARRSRGLLHSLVRQVSHTFFRCASKVYLSPLLSPSKLTTPPPAFASVTNVGEAHVLAYENPTSSRFLITSGSFQYPDMCRVLKQTLPPKLAAKVPDPEATKKEKTFMVDNSHAKEVLGLKFAGFEETIKGAAESLVKLIQS